MKLALFIFATLLLVSCGSIKPDAPEIIVQEDYEIPKAKPSYIKIPIKINLKPYFDETDNSIDRSFSGDESQCEGVSVKYLFNRSPIKFEGVGSKLRFDVDGKYRLWLSYCAACTDVFSSEPYCLTSRIYASCGVGEPMRKIHVGYETEIGVAKNYKLKSKTKLREIKALSPCKISVFEYDATSYLEEEVKAILEDMEKDIDKEIGAIDLRPEMEATWDAMAEPMDLEGYGFLELFPQYLAMDKIKYKGDTAYFNAVLKAYPRILSKQSGKKVKELPDLTSYRDREGFDINMDVYTRYDSLSAILTRNISGMEMDVKGKQVIFDSVKIHGASNKQLHIKLNFSGSKTGEVYLTGTPVFAADSQYISFPGIQFDIKSKSVLLKSAKWFFDKKVTDLLRKQTEIDLSPYMETLKTELNNNLNMELYEGVQMSGKVKKITVELIQPMSDQLHIQIHSLGNIAVKMD
ncbi:MAG: DUF4403 family protein [Crocinitomicaceae bacterium]|nr:DUF4403 family protein [Crocinitomicaceae bacterium]